MIPKGHTSILMASHRRAREWKLGLAKQGISAQILEARGSEAEKGDYHVAVRERDRQRAQAFVTKVLSGQERLPSVGALEGPLVAGAALIVVALLLLVLAAIL